MSAAAIEPLAWDSAFFGFPIARIATARPTPDELGIAVAACRDRGVRCAYLLLDAADADAAEAAQRLGFVLRDVRVELDRPIAAGDADTADDAVAIGAAGREQLPALEALVRERFTMSRFFADPRFARERCRELYVAWLRRGLDGDQTRWTLATTDLSGCIVCRDQAAGAGAAIELVAAQRPGDGTALVRAALARFARTGAASATVVTQAANVAAQRSYQRAGFRTARSALWFHRWFD